jgi:hypothetical protein
MEKITIYHGCPCSVSRYSVSCSETNVTSLLAYCTASLWQSEILSDQLLNNSSEICSDFGSSYIMFMASVTAFIPLKLKLM